MDVQKKFTEHQVVPDVIDEAPTNRATVRVCTEWKISQTKKLTDSFFLEVEYDSGAVVELGNVLTPTQVDTAMLHYFTMH